MTASERWLCGRTEVTVTGLNPAAFLNRCASNGIPFEQSIPMDECTLRLYLPTRLVAQAGSLAARCNCTLEAGRRTGAPEAVRRMRRRLALIVGAFGMIAALFASSLFVWDIRVVDNDSEVPDTRILNVLDSVGVGIGSFWPAFTSDMIRSAALTQLPDLCWLTVNVHGSRAEVIVRAAEPVPEVLDEGESIHVTATRSGVIEEIRVLEGDALVQPGDAVLAGDTLVSGTRQGGFGGPRTVRAQAEVTARTWYVQMAQAPLERQVKTQTGPKKLRIALIVGKRRINFYFGSGILQGECDKITRIRPLALEGVFSLPLALVTETVCPWTVTTSPWDENALAQALEEQLMRHLEEELGEEGEMVSYRFDRTVSDGRMIVTLRAECLERIDQEEPFTPMADTNEPAEEAVWIEPSQWIG